MEGEKVTASHILSGTATRHAAKEYTPASIPIADMARIHTQRRVIVGLILSALLDGDETQRMPSFHAGPYSDRYRHELQFRGLCFGDDVAGEWLYRNVEAEESAQVE